MHVWDSKSLAPQHAQADYTQRRRAATDDYAILVNSWASTDSIVKETDWHSLVIV